MEIIQRKRELMEEFERKLEEQKKVVDEAEKWIGAVSKEVDLWKKNFDDID